MNVLSKELNLIESYRNPNPTSDSDSNDFSIELYQDSTHPDASYSQSFSNPPTPRSRDEDALLFSDIEQNTHLIERTIATPSHTPEAIKPYHIDPIDKFLCTYTCVLNQEQIEAIKYLNSLDQETPNNNNAIHTEAQSVARVIELKANRLKVGLLVCCIIIPIMLSVYLLSCYFYNWDLDARQTNARFLLLYSTAAVLFLLGVWLCAFYITNDDE